MTNMIERVARAIALGVEDDPDNWRLYAMSACEAIRVATEECARVAQSETPLPAWIDDSDNGELTEAAYTFADAIASNIRALAKGDGE